MSSSSFMFLYLFFSARSCIPQPLVTSHSPRKYPRKYGTARMWKYKTTSARTTQSAFSQSEHPTSNINHQTRRSSMGHHHNNQPYYAPQQAYYPPQPQPIYIQQAPPQKESSCCGTCCKILLCLWILECCCDGACDC